MSKITFLAIACGCMAAGAGLAAWRSATPPPERHTPSNAIAAPASASLAAIDPWPDAGTAPVAELNPDADTTALLLESQTVEEFLDLADATSAEPLDDADRKRLTALIRSDAELRKHFRE
jgi:hypothetical protein